MAILKRMENEEFVKKVYLSSVEGMNRRGRPLGRWENRVKEYVKARREYMDRERWRSICCDHPVWGRFRRERGVRAID